MSMIEVRCGAKGGKCGRLLMTATDESGEWVFQPAKAPFMVRIMKHADLGDGRGPDMSDSGMQSMNPGVRCPKHGDRPPVDLLPLMNTGGVHVEFA